MNARIAVRSVAAVAAADARALVVVVFGLLSGLALILSTGAAWLNAT